MTFRSWLFAVTVVAAGVVATSAGHAESMAQFTRLDIKQTEVVRSVNDPENAAESGAQDVTVTLYPGGYSRRTENMEVILDIAARKQYHVDHGKKSVTAVSTYALPVFRTMERHNRLGLMKALTAALPAGNEKMKAVMESPVALDTILGSDKDSRDTAALISTSEKDGARIFRAEDKDLVTFIPSHKKISDAQRDSYKKYLIYESQIHPFIRNKLSDDEYFFQSLTYNFAEAGKTRTVTRTMGAITTAEEKPVPPADYKMIYAQDPAINAVIERTLQENAPDAASYARRIADYAAKGAMIDGFICLSVMGSALPPAQISAQESIIKPAIHKIMGDPETRALMQAISSQPANDAEFLSAVSTIESAKEKSVDYDHMLDLFIANHLRTGVFGGLIKDPAPFKRWDYSKKPFVNAITADPWLAGAYADLAAAYFVEFDTPTAWALWDQARRLNPALPQLETVDAYQSQALIDFPEFF